MKSLFKKTYTFYSLAIFVLWNWYNRILFRIKGVKFAKKLQIYKKMYLQVRNGTLTVGDNFTLTSGDCINPLCRNIRVCIHITHGGVVKIGKNVGMSSPLFGGGIV